jgi:xanthine dehydrogenase accessory factor
MIMRLIAQTGYALAQAGTDFALCAIVGQHGYTPREIGALMIVAADGNCVGTVGGGTIEHRAQQHAAQAIAEQKAALVRLSADDNHDASGLSCTGEVDVWIDYVDAKNPVYLEMYRAMVDAYRTGTQAYFGIYPETDANVHQCLLFLDGKAYGAFVNDAGALMAGKTQFPGFDVFTVSEKRRLLMRRIGSEAKAIIFGAGHVGSQLAPLTHMLGFETVVIDDRAEFANRERFPDVDRVIAADTLAHGVFDIESCDEDTFVIILTRGHSFDRDVLEQALHTNARYIGMIGSRAKRASIYEQLYAKGFTERDIARVHSPIGLDIAAQTPEEIAVSIAAELIRVRRTGR